MKSYNDPITVIIDFLSAVWNFIIYLWNGGVTPAPKPPTPTPTPIITPVPTVRYFGLTSPEIIIPCGIIILLALGFIYLIFFRKKKPE